MANKIIMIGCGGAGINTVSNFLDKAKHLGDGFSDIETLFIDTSSVTYDKHSNLEGPLFRIKPATHGVDDIDGSGGERSKNAKHIIEGVDEFLDKNQLTKPVVGTYYVVCSSLSSGSGSVISSLLTTALMKINMPVIPVLIGDSSNGLAAANTLDSIKSLHNIATKVVKKPMSVVYFNNNTYYKGSLYEAERAVDNDIVSTLAVISLFLSGENGDLDYQDLNNMVNQGSYTRISVPAGLYGLCVFQDNIVVPDGCTPITARGLTDGVKDPAIGVHTLHHKYGVVKSDNVKDLYGDKLPLFMVNFANFLTIEHNELTRAVNDFKAVMDNLGMDDIGSDSDDDTGLVF